MAIDEKKAVDALVWAGSAWAVVSVLAGDSRLSEDQRKQLAHLADVAPKTVKTTGAFVGLQALMDLAKQN